LKQIFKGNWKGSGGIIGSTFILQRRKKKLGLGENDELQLVNENVEI